MLPALRLAIVIACSSFALAAADGVATRDITPDMGGVTFGVGDAFAFDDGAMLVFAGRAGFRRSDDLGKHWKRAMEGYVRQSNGVEPFGYGFCQARAAPSTVYSLPEGISPGTVISGPGQISQPIFRSDDLGNRWRSVGAITDVRGIDCAVDAFNSETLYVVVSQVVESGPGVFKSTDGGRHFLPISGFDEIIPFRVYTSPTRPQTLYVIASEFVPDPDDEFETIVVSRVYVSTNGGASFEPLPATPANATRMFLHPSRDGLLFVSGLDAGGEPQLFRSTNGGATFNAVGPSGGWFVAFDPDDAATIYAVIGSDGFYGSRGFGAAFDRLPGPTANQTGPLGIGPVAVMRSPDGNRHIFIGTERGPYRSDDGGMTFTSIRDTYRGAGVNDLAMDAAGRLMVGAVLTVPLLRGASPGHPEPYENFGASLATTSPGADAGAIALSSVDSKVVVVATRLAGVFSTADEGATWKPAALRDGEEELLWPSFGSRVRAVFAPASPTRVYIFGGGRLFRSDDAGLSFQPGSDRLFAGPQYSIVVDPSDADVIFLAIDRNLDESPFTPLSGGLFKSVDGGQSVFGLGVQGEFSALAIDPHDSETVYAGRRAGGALRSTNGGGTWRDASRGLPQGAVIALAADPHIAGRVYAWVQGGGLFVSANGGGRWIAADTREALLRSAIDLGQAGIAVDREVPGRVYLGNNGVIQVDTLGAQP